MDYFVDQKWSNIGSLIWFDLKIITIIIIEFYRNHDYRIDLRSI